MLLLKANPELKKIFEKLLKTMKIQVTWTDIFMIVDNNLILAGDIRSLVFDFSDKRAYTNIIEIPSSSEHLDYMPNDTLLNNVMNMTLYAFGKWGIISGLKVDKDYQALNALFEAVLRPVKITPEFHMNHFRFYKDGIQITYEEMILSILRLLKNEGKLKEGQSLGTADTANEDDEEDYEIGLWHNMCWKTETCSFQKVPQSEDDDMKSRIGNNFYRTNCLCPKCNEKLYMAVYPVNKELLIETEEGRVFMARTYTCHNCNIFYTPRPHKLLQEGDVYTLKFDEDRTAYEDYLSILGKKAERTSNYKFNEFESERNQQKEQDADVDASTDADIRIDARADRDKDAGIDTNADRDIRMNVRADRDKDASIGTNADRDIRMNARADSGRRANTGTDSSTAAHADIDANAEEADKPRLFGRNKKQSGENNRNAASKPQHMQNTPPVPKTPQQEEQPTQTAAATPSASAQTTAAPNAPLPQNASKPRQQSTESFPSGEALNTAALAGKTTEELKAILTGLKQKQERLLPQSPGDTSMNLYMDAVENALQNKLSAKYDARVGTLDKLSTRLLSDLKKQIEKETSLPSEKRMSYLRQIDDRIYQAEKTALEQQVELGKKKTYAEIEQIISNIEKQNLPQELKQEPLEKLKQIKADRAKREAEHLLTHMPLHLDRKQLAGYFNKLDQYKEVDITPYQKYLEERKDMAEKEEIEAMMKRGGKKDRDSLWKLYEQLQRQDYKEENKAPYLEKLHAKIQKMDEDKIEKICPSIASLSFIDGLKAYDEISQGMFLPELKLNTLDMIQRRLTKLKTDESAQLMRKLKHDLEEKEVDCQSFYFYNAREELRLAQSLQNRSRISDESEPDDENPDEDPNRASMLCAINGYASARHPYEYPLMVCDTTKSRNGKEGFVLTPDHIFCHTFYHSNAISIPDIEKVQIVRRFFEKGIYVKYINGQKEKLPNKLKRRNQNAFADVFDEFVKYLQDRPESRDIEYMAKEKHDIIRCYRCGFAYKGGICPKCGSAQNR